MRLILAVLATILFAGCAEAATCTWQGGTASWTNVNTASWSCGHVPISTDSVVFDGTSGGGTVTVAALSGATATIGSFTWGAFTGTLDFDTNDPSITVIGTPCFSGTGTGTTRKILTAGATFTCSIATTAAGLVTMSVVTGLDAASDFTGTIVFSSTANAVVRGFIAGTSLHWGTLTIPSNTSAGSVNISGTTAVTFDTINFTGPGALYFPNGITTTITNAFNWTVTGSSPISLVATNNPGLLGTIHASAVSSMDKFGVRDLTFNTSAVTATNSYDLGDTAGTITITGPVSSGAHSLVIGGP